MSKKILTALCLLSLLLTACSKPKMPEQASPVPSKFSNIKEAADSSLLKSKITDNGAKSGIIPAPPTDKFDHSLNIDKTLILHKNGVVVNALSLEYSPKEVKIMLEFENNTDEDRFFSFDCYGYSVIVNGYSIPDLSFNLKVPPHKKVTHPILLDKKYLELIGIDKIADLKLRLTFNDEKHTYVEDRFSAHLKTSIADSYDYTEDTFTKAMKKGLNGGISDVSVLYYKKKESVNKHGFRILSEALISTSDNDIFLLLEAQNDREKDVRIHLSEPFINGLKLSDYLYFEREVSSKTRMVIKFDLKNMEGFDTINKELLDLLGITDVNSLSLLVTLNYFDDSLPKHKQRLSFRFSEEKSSIDSEGAVVYEDKNLLIISKGILDVTEMRYGDPSPESHLVFCIKNKGKKKIELEVENDGFLSVNGHNVDFNFSTLSLSGRQSGLFLAQIHKSELEKFKINKIEKATIKFCTLDSKSHKLIKKHKFPVNYH